MRKIFAILGMVALFLAAAGIFLPGGHQSSRTTILAGGGPLDGPTPPTDWKPIERQNQPWA